MKDKDQKKNRHFILEGFAQTEKFTHPRLRIEKTPIPERDRRSHGKELLGRLEALKPELEIARAAQEAAGLDGGFGIQVEFESFPDIELAFESLARERSGIELLNVRHKDKSTFATIFVPDGKLEHFEGLIRDYLEEKRDSKGRVRDHKALLNTIQQIRAASLQALWTDDSAVFPISEEETFWWEVWLPIRGDRAATVSTFRKLAEAQELQVGIGEIEFPERTVLIARASMRQMQRSMMALNSIAELRRAKETAQFFDALPPQEQNQWLGDLLKRSRFPHAGKHIPYVCLLDTGINNGHPLISPALADSDRHTVEPAWGTDDSEGHGTAMAGLALAGDFTEALASSKPFEISCRLESVKLLPRDGDNIGDARHHGYLTAEAVGRPEITESNRLRVFSMAIRDCDKISVSGQDW